jgi:hypothetical protein
MPLATSAACLPRQIGAPVVARGRAHQHAHRHLVCCGRPQWVWMSREVSPEVPDTSVLLFLRYVHVRSACICMTGVWLAALLATMMAVDR